MLAIIPAALAVIVLLLPSSSHANPSPWPSWWYRQAMCIHAHESTDWHKVTDWRGYPSPDHGGMQIDVRTWAAYAPRGYPTDPAYATPFEQLVVAYKVWKANGHRWGGAAWPNSSRECGLY